MQRAQHVEPGVRTEHPRDLVADAFAEGVEVCPGLGGHAFRGGRELVVERPRVPGDDGPRPRCPASAAAVSWWWNVRACPVLTSRAWPASAAALQALKTPRALTSKPVLRWVRTTASTIVRSVPAVAAATASESAMSTDHHS